MGEPRKVNVELVDEGTEPYKILEAIWAKHHSRLVGAEIVLAWRKSWKADVDGHLVLGQCMKATDLQREFSSYDFVIFLNKDVWEDPGFTKEKKEALIDHELCHAAPALDKETDEQKEDERGRLCWRVRKHDIEEFREIVQRHGCYKADLEQFAEALIESKQGKLAMTA